MTKEEYQNREASMLAEYYGYEAQRDTETGHAFALRVAENLRRDGHMIEAHELTQGCRWDDQGHGDAVMNGIVGAIANAMHRPGSCSIGEDIAAGVVVQNPEPKPSLAAMLMMVELLGRR
jgi:hypothetical protein